jgi:hypothetical protein
MIRDDDTSRATTTLIETILCLYLTNGAGCLVEYIPGAYGLNDFGLLPGTISIIFRAAILYWNVHTTQGWLKFSVDVLKASFHPHLRKEKDTT